MNEADPRSRAAAVDATRELLTDAELARVLEERPGWRRDRDAIVRELPMRDFEDALSFVQRVADAAVDYRRRPDMCISAFNRVRLAISNLHHAGLTLAELRVARKVDAVLDARHPHVASR